VEREKRKDDHQQQADGEQSQGHDQHGQQGGCAAGRPFALSPCSPAGFSRPIPGYGASLGRRGHP
jgi:hypothetical protein